MLLLVLSTLLLAALVSYALKLTRLLVSIRFVLLSSSSPRRS
jgi:hypothetical protein